MFKKYLNFVMQCIPLSRSEKSLGLQAIESLNYIIGEEEIVPRMEANVCQIMTILNQYTKSVSHPQYFEMVLEIIKIYADALDMDVIPIVKSCQ